MHVVCVYFCMYGITNVFVHQNNANKSECAVRMVWCVPPFTCTTKIIRMTNKIKLKFDARQLKKRPAQNIPEAALFSDSELFLLRTQNSVICKFAGKSCA